ncbi:MAG: hypothetical protein QXT05_01045 [Candidatus Bilamarchaeaceae archaeon]
MKKVHLMEKILLNKTLSKTLSKKNPFKNAARKYLLYPVLVASFATVGCATPKYTNKAFRQQIDNLALKEGTEKDADSVENTKKELAKATQSVSSKFPGGVCIANNLGQVMYRFDNGAAAITRAPIDDSIGDLHSLFCFAKNTVVVGTAGLLILRNSYASQEGVFVGGYHKERDYISYCSMLPLPKNEEIFGSVAIGSVLYLVVKNYNKNVNDVYVFDSNTEKHDGYILGADLFNKNVAVTAFNGFVFIGGEAEKGKKFLFAVRQDDKGLAMTFFEAKEDWRGEASFEDKGDHLLLKVGEKTLKITVKESDKQIENENTGCFSAGSSYACVTVER